MRRRQVCRDTDDEQSVEKTTPRRMRVMFKAVVKRWCLENNGMLSATFGQEVPKAATAKQKAYVTAWQPLTFLPDAVRKALQWQQY